MPEDPNASQWKKFVRIKRPTVKHVRVRARKIEGATTRHAHRFIISRWANLRDVRRHALGWLVLTGLLVVATGLQLFWIQGAYSSQQPVAGGTYAEGVIGRVDTINPIYASTQSERSASHLIFSSLFRYDASNSLESDLGETWKQSDEGRTYTVQMRRDAKWHDGKPVTARDVEFTLRLIKNPQTRSYLRGTWQNVQVRALDDHVLEFKLPSAYAPFPHAMTFGVLPKHVLETVSPLRLREHPFNREPLGSGPFKFRSIQIINPDVDRVVVQVDKNQDYYRGQVKLDRFQIHTYKDHDALRQGFLSREINAANELTSTDIHTIKKQAPATVINDAPIYDGVYAFLKNDSPVLQDVAVRRALVKATDREALRKVIQGFASPLEGPLLSEQVKDIDDLKQAAFDPAKARSELEQAGWIVKDGIRVKDGTRLQLNVIAPRLGDFPDLLGELARQWRSVGVDVKTQVVDTNTYEQNIIKPRAYDVLVSEIALGVDPDVFAYWHSSQASVFGLNLSNYRSGVADDALASARSRSEPELREAKYRGFVARWHEDAPAVALFQPHLRYVSTDSTNAIDPTQPVIDTLNRYHRVDQWTVVQDDQFKTP